MKKYLLYIIIFVVISSFKGIDNLHEKDTVSCFRFLTLGIRALKESDFENAEKFLKSSIEQNSLLNESDSLAMAEALSNYGVLCKKMYNLSDAAKYYEYALKIFNKLKDRPVARIGAVCSNLGNLYRMKYNFEKAEIYYKQALQIFIEKNDSSNIGKVLNNIGLTYFESGNFKRAEELFIQSFAIKTKIKDELWYNTCQNLARTYSQLERNEKAEYYYNKAIQNLEENFGTQNIDLAHVFLNYGIFCENTKQNEKALHLFNESLKLFVDKLGNKNTFTANCLLNIGDYYCDTDNPEKGLIYYQKALISVGSDFSDENIKKNPNDKQCTDDIKMLEILSKKADALYSFYRKNTESDTNLLVLSNQTYQIASELLEKTNQNYYDKQSRRELLKIEKNTLTNAAFVAYKLYKKTNNPHYETAAFRYSEMSKTMIISASLADGEAMKFGGIPDSLLYMETNLQRKKELYKNILYAERQKTAPDIQKIEKTEAKLYTATRASDKLLLHFEKYYKKYYELKHQSRFPKIEEIQKRIADSEILVEYMLPDSKNRLYNNQLLVFIISKNIFYTQSIQIDSLFFINISRIHNSLMPEIFKKNSKISTLNYTKAAFAVYQKTIQPFEKYFIGKQVVIIQDKELSGIPFEVLLTQMCDSDRIEFKSLDYLIKKYAISYDYSASLRKSAANHSVQISESGNLLACVPTYDNEKTEKIGNNTKSFLGRNRSKLHEIKAAETEVDNISDIYTSTVLSGKNASETTFKNKASNFAILHLAMHALVDEQNPMYSKLVFSNQTDTIDDGFLNTYELYNMKLNAQLAVLSACNTGFGESLPGEGVVSLAQGFKYAGVESIVMTLWSVEDKSSADLMSLFYKYLSQKMPKGIAMQRAKLDFIKNSDPLKSHPYFWAAYMNIGDNSPVFMKKSIENYFFYVLGAAVLFLIILFSVYRKILVHQF